MNVVLLVGRLVRDPELRYTQANQAVCTFTLAVDKNLSKEKRQEMESQNKPTADFPRITVWGKTAENAAKYLSKGSQCAIEGRIETGSYVDKETGKNVYTTQVVASSVEFIGSNNRQSGQQQPASSNQQQAQNNQNYTSQAPDPIVGGDDDYFDDDFTEIQDDGRIPF